MWGVQPSWACWPEGIYFSGKAKIYDTEGSNSFHFGEAPPTLPHISAHFPLRSPSSIISNFWPITIISTVHQPPPDALRTSWLKQPVTCNATLRHSSARLQYQLHRGLEGLNAGNGDGWQLCSDGVLLWPEEMLEPEGLATREAYLGEGPQMGGRNRVKQGGKHGWLMVACLTYFHIFSLFICLAESSRSLTLSNRSNPTHTQEKRHMDGWWWFMVGGFNGSSFSITNGYK